MSDPNSHIPAEDLPDTVWLDRVQLSGSSEMVRVTLHKRNGSDVTLRHVDPAEPEPERIPIHKGDRISVMQAISQISHNTAPEPGDDDVLLLSQRVVPVRREPGRVVARTLRFGEVDTGARVHVAAGEEVTFEAGGIFVEMDFLDNMEASETGHVPLAPSLWTWYSVGTGQDPARVRYLLAAARRLDAANLLIIQVQRHRKAVNAASTFGPLERQHFFQLVGAVELAVVALGRTVDMVVRAQTLIGSSQAVPPVVAANRAAINHIRNAYEHIEDRALGKVNRRPDPEALTIFDYRRLMTEDVVEYGSYELDLTEVPAIVAEIRNFIKDAAGSD